MTKQLWQSSDPQRYFYIPLDATIYTGEFSIFNTENQTHQVRLSSIEPFEITATEAQKMLEPSKTKQQDDLGQLFSELLNAGKEIWNSLQEDDSDDESDEDLPDNVVDLDTDEDSDDLSFGDIINDFFKDLEEPLAELRSTLISEVNNVAQEVKKIGKEVAQEMDSNDNRDLLRSIGEQLIRMSEKEPNAEEESSEDDIVAIHFARPSIDESNQQPVPDEAESAASPIEAAPVPSDGTKEPQSPTMEEVDPPAEDTSEKSPPDTDSVVEWPSASALRRKKKSDLLLFAGELGLSSLSSTNTKKDILAAIESKRQHES